MVYDLIIIGGSAAAMAAGIYAARGKLNFIIISKDIGGEVANSGEIENYPGFVKTNGLELCEKFRNHLKNHEVVPEIEVVVKKVKKEGKEFLVEAEKKGKVLDYRAKSVIIATGVRPRELNIPGERELRGKGVSYCSVCDGPLFKDRVVAVVGGGNSALKSVLMLSTMAAKVYLVTINAEIKGEMVLIEKVKKMPNLAIIPNAVATKILGDEYVIGLEYLNKEINKTENIVVNGIFIYVGMIPNSQMADLVEKNKNGEIIVNRLGRTNVAGLFAAGDVTDVPYKQIAIASGMGVTAALAAIDYLNK